MRFLAVTALCALLLLAAAPSAAAAGLGRLLLSLPDKPLAQLAELDRPAPLADHPDPNAKGSRHDSRNRHYFKLTNTGFKQDTFTVFSAVTGQVAYEARQLPRVSEAAPALHADGVFSFVMLDIASDTGVFTVVDLAPPARVLASSKGDVGKFLHWWMPDGSLARLHAHTGELSTARVSLQGPQQAIEWRTTGRVAPPLPGAIFGDAAPSPDGAELLLSTVEERTRRTALWMLDLRSGALQRITDDGFMSFVMWSPDGQMLLLRRDNVSHIGSTVQGQCSYWLAPRAARGVSGAVPGQSHATLRQVLYDAGLSAPASLPCGRVSAWLR